MIYDDAKELMTALEVNKTDTNFEIALEVINKYGSYKRALQATIGIEFKKKESLLITLLGSEEAESKDANKDEAKRLIVLVMSINDQVFKDSQRMSIQFDELVSKLNLEKMISSEDLAVLNQVRPHCNAKLLIRGISHYPNGAMQISAFIDALKYKPSDLVQIANPLEKLRIRR